MLMISSLLLSKTSVDVIKSAKKELSDNGNPFSLD
jgi:hypothetical protein